MWKIFDISDVGRIDEQIKSVFPFTNRADRLAPNCTSYGGKRRNNVKQMKACENIV